jgi:hypothetical protein
MCLESPEREQGMRAGFLTWMLVLLCQCHVVLIGLGAEVPSKEGIAGRRIVAVGDVHGSLEGLIQILRKTGLIDSKNSWIGQNSILVMTGDLLDRGSDDRAVLDLLMTLEKKAPKNRGSVQVVLGNHEVMNLTGDLRYVSQDAYSSFADKSSEKRRQSALKKYGRYLKNRAKALNQEEAELSPEGQQKWLERHPPGYVEHRTSFSPKGRYGRWLRKHPGVLKIGDIVFVHGGFSPQIKLAADDLQAVIKSELNAFDRLVQYFVQSGLALPFFDLSETTQAVVSEVENLRSPEGVVLSENQQDYLRLLEKFLDYVNWLIFHPDGPFWFRGFAEWTEEEGMIYLQELQRVFSARHFVVGHTAQLPREIKVRFDGAVFLIDTGMLSSYFKGGGPSALEIQDGQFRAVYLDGEKLLWDGRSVPAVNH